MSEFSRKKLKQDRFAEVVGQEVAVFQRHKTAIIVGAVAVIAAIVGAFSYMTYRQTVAEEATAAFLDAVRLYHGAVTTEPRPGRITFTTSGERQRRVTEAFDAVLRDYPNREEATGAEYYLGLMAVEQGDYDGARQKLEAAISRGGNYAGLARLVLADTYAQQGNVEEARKVYDALIANPTEIVPKERAKLALARMLVDKDPAAARPILEELMAEPGPVSVAAGSTMRQIEGS
ncbi:MAG: tetratricopeptide repeat protein [Bryobacterales bacterium]